MRKGKGNIKAQAKRYRDKYPEKSRAKSKKSYLKNREKRLVARKEYYNKNKEKYKMWAKLDYMQRKGIIKLNKCEECGSLKLLIMHHEDYSKPFEIKVLCRKCHNILHKSIPQCLSRGVV